MDELASLGKGEIEGCNKGAIKIFVRAFQELKRERLVQILLDVDGLYIAHNVLSWGEISITQGRYRQIIEPVIATGASTFVLLHNHPSGHLRPSRTDIEMTRKTGSLCNVLDIRFADHFIVAGSAVLSMKRAGYLL